MSGYSITLWLTGLYLLGSVLFLLILLNSGIGLEVGLDLLVYHPIGMFVGYYVVRTFFVDTFSVLSGRSLLLDKHILFAFQLLLLILAYDIVSRLVSDPNQQAQGLFLSALFVSDVLSSVGVFMFVKDQKKAIFWTLDQFQLDVFKTFAWFLIIPSIYLLMLAHL